MYLSILMPCYNEEKVLEKTYVEVLACMPKACEYELLFVDDGSTDQTFAMLKRLADQDNHVKYIKFSRNFGKESAMLAGLAYVTGEAVIIMDADLQHPPQLFQTMLDYYQEGYDQVIARRTRKGDKAHKTCLARAYYKLVNKLTDVKMLDGVGDFRLLSRKAINALLALKEYNRFSKGLFSWIGFKQIIVDYDNQERAAGQTKWSLKKLLNYGIQGILSFNDKPLRVCFQLGLICIGVSLLYVLWTFMEILLHGVSVGGYFTTIFAILVIGGVQLLSIGVLGEYIGKIYYEVKKRPHFLIDESNINTVQTKKVEDMEEK